MGRRTDGGMDRWTVGRTDKMDKSLLFSHAPFETSSFPSFCLLNPKKRKKGNKAKRQNCKKTVKFSVIKAAKETSRRKTF